MLKRLYSKRSGFTLVEIMVAFAVFAIMAGMIAQILNLAVSARNYNNEYARALSSQEKVLTIIEKTSDDYNDLGATGDLKFTFGDTELPAIKYQTKSAADPREITSAEGLNYFLSPVGYDSEGETPPIEAGGNSGGGSQMSRMDTRITGTKGFKYIKVWRVIKDTHTQSTDPSQPNYLAEGNTRYFIQVSAAANKNDGFEDEDIPYAQFRMYFYSDKLDAAASAVTKTGSDGSTYTEDVYEAAKILNVGYLKGYVQDVANTGLTESNIQNGTDNNYNIYTIEQSGSNGIRIGTPFVTGRPTGYAVGYNTTKGLRFESSLYSNFYVEFEGDPNLTTASFGYNGEEDDNPVGSMLYSACPNYIDSYYDDGTPKYYSDGDHVNIYGAYLYTRHYD